MNDMKKAVASGLLLSLLVLTAPHAYAQVATTASVSGTSAAFTRTLSVGSTGSDVSALQSLLIAKGFSIPGAPNGIFGAKTRTALATYQAQNGITPATGTLDANTRAHLTASGTTAPVSSSNTNVVTAPAVTPLPATSNMTSASVSADLAKITATLTSVQNDINQETAAPTDDNSGQTNITGDANCLIQAGISGGVANGTLAQIKMAGDCSIALRTTDLKTLENTVHNVPGALDVTSTVYEEYLYSVGDTLTTLQATLDAATTVPAAVTQYHLIDSSIRFYEEVVPKTKEALRTSQLASSLQTLWLDTINLEQGSCNPLTGTCLNIGTLWNYISTANEFNANSFEYLNLAAADYGDAGVLQQAKYNIAQSHTYTLDAINQTNKAVAEYKFILTGWR